MNRADKTFLALIIAVLVIVVGFLVYWNYAVVSEFVTIFGQEDASLAKGYAIVLDIVLILGLILRTRANTFWVHAAIWMPLAFIMGAGMFAGFTGGGFVGAGVFAFAVLLLVVAEQNLLPFLPKSWRTTQEAAPVHVQEAPTELVKVPVKSPEEVADILRLQDPLPGWPTVKEKFDLSEYRARKAVKLAKEEATV